MVCFLNLKLNGVVGNVLLAKLYHVSYKGHPSNSKNGRSPYFSSESADFNHWCLDPSENYLQIQYDTVSITIFLMRKQGDLPKKKQESTAMVTTVASFSNLGFLFGDAHESGKSAGSTGPPSSTGGEALAGEAYHSCSAAAPFDSASKYFNSSPAALITTSRSEDSQLGWDNAGLPLMWGGLACRTELWLSPKKTKGCIIDVNICLLKLAGCFTIFNYPGVFFKAEAAAF